MSNLISTGLRADVNWTVISCAWLEKCERNIQPFHRIPVLALKTSVIPAHLKITPFPKAETQLHHLVGKQENLPSQACAVACAGAIPCSQSANNTALARHSALCSDFGSLEDPPHSPWWHLLPLTCRGTRAAGPWSMWKHLQLRNSEVLFAFVLQI